MTSIDIAIADAVAQLLTPHLDQFAGFATIERRLLPIYSQSDLASGRIAIAPRIQNREPGTRSAVTSRTYAVQIAPHLRAKHDAHGRPDEDQGVAFLGVMQQIADILDNAAAKHRFAGTTLLRLVSEPLYDHDLAQSPGVWRGVWTVTFKAVRSPAR